MVSPAMLFETFERWTLVVHGSEAPTDAEWNAYVDALRAQDERNGRGVIVFSDGGGPTALQRRMIAGLRMRTVVVTSSKVVRGMVTALKWIGASIEAYPPSAIREVFNDLGVEPAQTTPILERLARMRLALAGKTDRTPAKGDLLRFLDQAIS